MWMIFCGRELFLEYEVGVDIISEQYFLDYCLYACQHTSAIQCTAVVYDSKTNLCKMYNATRNTPGASLKNAANSAYLELFQGKIS